MGSGSAWKTASFVQQCAICTHVQLADLVSKAPKSQDEFKASTNNLTVARAPEQVGEPLMIEAQHELAKSDTKHAKTSVPDRETPLQGRTDEPEKNDQKPPNVSHEAALTNWLLLAAGCWLLRAGCLLLASCLLLPTACCAACSLLQKRGSRTGKHHGSEGRRSYQIASKNCLTCL